ncbi:MAG: hypothetical protein KA190_09655 [Kofleriaceae bacterium]|nr:hypothetical protein [Kofleriaceae bacterium]
MRTRRMAWAGPGARGRGARAVAASVAIAIAVAVATAAAAPPAPPVQAPPATGFDHARHDRTLVVSGGDTVACARCHGSGGLARPGHGACFAGCHLPAPTRGERLPAPATDPGRPSRHGVCVSCHPTGPGQRAGATAALREGPDRDWSITMSHAGHRAAPCVECHAAQAAAKVRPPARPHARCATCHDGAPAFALEGGCDRCHVAAADASAGRGPRLRTGLLAVTPRFDHRRHGRAAKAEAVACDRCHPQVATADGADLPAPSAADCASCHDGRAAFSTTGPCRSCHRDPADARYPVARPAARFDHDRHAPRLGGAACTSCHRPGASATMSSVGHGACAEAGCHQADFGARSPTTCGACHASAEPWRPLVVDVPPPARSQHGVILPHARHPAPCDSCHQRSPAGELRLVRGHLACASAGCHDTLGGPAPTLDRCEACHRGREQREHAQRRRAAPWSVRTRFRHGPHAHDPRSGAALPCATCHVGLDAARGLADLPAPTKATCAPCHDGAIAFKLTGPACERCHGR